MKSLISSFRIILLILSVQTLQAQTLNWAGGPDGFRHLFRASVGLEHGAILGIAYGYKVNMGPFPAVLTAEYSMPLGQDFPDDFKLRAGAQIRWAEAGDFRFSTNVNGIFRRYENSYARIENFGCEVSGALGYYRPGWYLAGEFGFDKAIVSHFRHSASYRESFPGVIDGWYEPATGGNFFYGLQAGVSFGKQDIFLRAGRLISEDFKSAPALPFYGQLGYNVRI